MNATNGAPSAARIATFIGATERLQVLDGRRAEDVVVTEAAPVADASTGAMAFLTAVAAAHTTLRRPGPTLLLLDDRADLASGALADAGVAAVVRTPQPRLDFLRAASEFLAPRRTGGVHPSAVVAASAVLGAGVSIGPLCTVGERCRIGDGSRLEAGVHLYADVTVGRDVHIHAGAVIGADGFGYERNEDGALEHFPHLGRVEIGDDVEIGANACIDRGSLGATRIGRGAKVDNLVMIAHNAQVGEDSAVIALAVVAGSARIGRRAWVSPGAVVRDNVTVGDDATVAMASLVTKDVAPGITVAGAPARDLGEFQALLKAWRGLLAEEELS